MVEGRGEVKSETLFNTRNRYSSMTLVQSSFSNKGETVIMVADRLLTSSFGGDFPDYETEGTSPKICLRGNVGIGFAGSALYADMATSEVTPSSDFDKIVEKISKFVNSQRDIEINDEIIRVTGIRSKDFFPTSGNVPEEVRGYVYGWLNNFRFNFQCIVAGFDKNNKARISYITDNGTIISATNFGIGSIGSGSAFSQIFFDQYNYDISIPEIDGLFFAYKAKRWAEALIGVGLKTDIVILRKNDTPIRIKDEDKLMQEIRETYDKENKKTSEIRAELLNQLIKNSSGILR